MLRVMCDALVPYVRNALVTVIEMLYFYIEEGIVFYFKIGAHTDMYNLFCKNNFVTNI